MEICHKTKDLDLIIPKIYHQDLEKVSKEEIQGDHQEEEVSEKEIQGDHQEEEVIQEIIIIIQKDWTQM